jgi:hypothetical protein
VDKLWAKALDSEDSLDKSLNSDKDKKMDFSEEKKVEEAAEQEEFFFTEVQEQNELELFKQSKSQNVE